jgi:enamine deaminase RidA (YjgF/YER057c/UK114 family)
MWTIRTIDLKNISDASYGKAGVESRGVQVMRVATLVTAAVLSVGCVNAPRKGEGEMSAEKNFQLFIPETMPRSAGYSQVALVTGGRTVFIAGQVGLDRSGNIVGRDDFRGQVRQVFENLKAAIESVGGSFRDVIKLNGYFLDLANLPDFRKVRDEYVNVESPPASTAVQVPRLFRPEFLVEIEAIAVVNGR